MKARQIPGKHLLKRALGFVDVQKVATYTFLQLSGFGLQKIYCVRINS